MAQKQQKNNRKETKASGALYVLQLVLDAIGIGLGIFLIVTLVLYLQPISKAYALNIEKDSFILHIDDEGDIGYNFSEVTDQAYVLKLQRGKQHRIRFTSEDESIATVSDTGHITAVGKGSTEIKVKVSDIEKTIHVDSFVRGTGLQFEPADADLNVGDTLSLKTILKPGDAVLFDKLTYSVSAEETIRIDQAGNVTAVGPGLAYAYAKADGLTAEAAIRIYQPMTGIALTDIEDGQTIHIERGDSYAFPVTYFPANTTDPRELHYSLSDPDAGTIDENGVFTALGRGPVTLYVECNGFTDSVSIEMHVTMTAIGLNHEEMTINYQKQDQLTFGVIPEDTTDSISYSYSSSNSDVVSVDENGLVTAKGPGTAGITVSVNGFEKTCVYTVLVPVTSVSISQRNMIMNKGDSTQLGAVVKPDFTTEEKSIYWISDNTGVVVVDGNGVVTAVGSGSTYVHAIHGEIYASCKIQVFDPTASAAKADRIITFGMQFLGTRYVYGGDSLTGGIDCSSFTMQCFRTAGVSLPRTSNEQVHYGIGINAGDMSQWKRGDLIFYATRGEVNHVAIYIGDGQILHAAQSLGKVSISAFNYNGNVPVAVRRYF